MSADSLEGWRGFESVPGDALPIEFSPHALERWAERVHAVDLDAARTQLCRMLSAARVTRERPSWIDAREREAPAWLLLGDVALPLWENAQGELVAATALTPGGFPETHRANVNRGRQTARAGKRASRWAQKHHGGGRPDHLPSKDENV